MTNGSDDTRDLDVLAGEYVLGVLDDAEYIQFEQRLMTDVAAQSALAAARERLLELDLTADEVAPSDNLWTRIADSLSSATSNVVALDARRQADANPPVAAAKPQRSGFWKGFAAASAAAALAAGFAFAVIMPERPHLVVVLLDDKANPVSIVETFADQRIRIVPLGSIDVPAGRTLQVWTLPNQQSAPVSIGLMPSVSATTLSGPPLPEPGVDQLYEITLEPAGGSPTGRPTGPIIGKGFARVPQI